MSALSGEAGRILMSKLIDAAFVAFQAKLERDVIVDMINAAVEGGMPLEEVPEYIKRMAREAVGRL